MAFNTGEDLIQGKHYQIWISSTSGTSSGTPEPSTIIAYGTSASISIDADTIEASSKFSCGWKAASVGTAGYTIQSDSLYTENSGATSFSTLLELMLDENAAWWWMGKEEKYEGDDCSANPHTLDIEEVYFSGQGIPTSLSLEASADDFVTCSCTIQGTGEVVVHKPA